MAAAELLVAVAASPVNSINLKCFTTRALIPGRNPQVLSLVAAFLFIAGAQAGPVLTVDILDRAMTPMAAAAAD
ncbi:MAG: hypothetical protein CMJ39_00415 [Phycisphaerae bacterium]|nr:hypothetical protein [Phycisphaerae bacterium]